MTVRLVNSAIMPLPGIYRAEMIDKQEFVSLLVQANKDKNLVAYIGYESTLDYVRRITGHPLVHQPRTHARCGWRHTTGHPTQLPDAT